MGRNEHHAEVEAYGKIKEGLHLSGYSFERFCKTLEWLLQENRWKLGGQFNDVNDFMDSLRFEQLRPTVEARKRIAKLIKVQQPKVSNRRIAKTLGVHHDTIDRDTGGNPPPGSEKTNKNNAAKNDTGGNPPPSLSGAAAATLVKRREERIERDQNSEQRTRAVVEGTGNVEIRHGDFRQVLADLVDVDAIITDPPYEREFLPLLRELGALSHRILKPNGIMAVLYGHTYLPEAFSMLSGFRPYRWTACYLEKGNGYVSKVRAVQSNWKPILIYGGNEPRFADLFQSIGDADGKLLHMWGQNFDAFKSIVERLTEPGSTIVDPFAGGGTTLFAARSIGRHAIGCDIDENAVRTIQHMMEEAA